MKHLLYYLRRTVLCILMLVFAVACTDDYVDVSEGKTAAINIKIPVLETVSRVVGTPKEDAIYTLRIIILSQGGISVNRCFTKEDLDGNPDGITIDNVPVGNVQIYAIANEESIGKDYSELSLLQEDLEPNTKKVLIKDLDRKFFPKKGSVFMKESLGLPMSWMDKNFKVLPPSEQPQTVTVRLQRAVAKLNVIMENTLTESIVIDRMSFGSFFGDQLYLFQELDLDVPTGTLYESKSYENLNIEIKGQSDYTLVCYVYPSYAWKGNDSPYTLGFHTKSGKEYYPQAFVNDYGALNSIARNTQLNINAILSKTANVEISFEVLPWVTEYVDVPSFN